MVTHAGIDVYSRMAVYLKCATNNQAVTVYNALLEVAHQYGLPSQVRSDQGRENVYVARHMIRHHKDNRHSAIVGSSVYNQRIERFWHDMHRCVTRLYYRLFYFMEHQ